MGLDDRLVKAKDPTISTEELQVLAKDKAKKVVLAVLEHPKITSEMLDELSERKSVDIRRAVAVHSLTSSETLDKLADDQLVVKKAVACNPHTSALTLDHLLESGDAATDVYLREAIVTNPNASEHVLERCSQDDDVLVRTLCAQNPNISEGLLDRLSEDPVDHVLRTVLYNPNISSDTITRVFRRLWGLWDHKDRTSMNIPCLAAIGQNPKTPVDILYTLATLSEKPSDDEQYWVSDIITLKQSVASNPNAPASLLTELSHNKDSGVRSLVAQHPNTPEDILINLWNDALPPVATSVYLNLNTPDFLFEQGYESNFSLGTMARASTVPVFLLEKLATNKSEDVRWEVAHNPITPDYILNRLATDDSGDVKRMVIGNPNVLDETLSILAADKQEDIAFSAIKLLCEHGHDVKRTITVFMDEDRVCEWEPCNGISGFVRSKSCKKGNDIPVSIATTFTHCPYCAKEIKFC